MASIIDQVREAVSPDLVRSVSGLIGESTTTTSKGFAAVLPAILAGIADTASTPTGAQRVRSMITDGGLGASMLEKIPGMLAGGATTDTLMAAGRQLLGGLFGNKQDGVTEVVARSSGMSGSAMRSLMSLAAPLVMSVLGREITSRGLDASGLMNLLTGQRSSIAALAPAGLASILGFKQPTVSPVPADTERYERTERDDRVEPATERRAGLPGWLLPAAVAALAGLALLFVLRPWAPEVAVERPTAPTASVPSASPPTAPVAPPQQTRPVTLPSGDKLDVKEGSFLQQITAYLSNPSDAAVPRRFVFDDLTFETGSTALTAASAQVVDALGRTMKAYPGVNISLEGFTDSSGDAAANRALSRRRADAIKDKLVQAGIAADRIATAGYGQERPVASNDTEEGRARNRRTEVVVTKR
jgi:outer membrane protein OmpA-like peptidoglycan-associated protein